MTIGPGSDDPFDARLREVLRRMPHGAPPPGFAHAVASAADGRAHPGERWWVLAPALAFLPAALFAVAIYGGGWAGGFELLWQALGGAAAFGWIAVAGFCLALSGMVARLQPRDLPGPP